MSVVIGRSDYCGFGFMTLTEVFCTVYMLWFNFLVGLKFRNQFNFNFPLSQIMVMNPKQKQQQKIKPQHTGIHTGILYLYEFSILTSPQFKIQCTEVDVQIMSTL